MNETDVSHANVIVEFPDKRLLSHTSPYMTGFLIFTYSSIFLLAILGNAFVIITVTRKRNMRSVINYFLCNLSVADMLVAIVCLPLTLLQSIFKGWHYGQFLCKTVPYLQGTAVCASAFFLTVVAFDRFLAICYPMKKYINPRRGKLLAATIWTVSPLILLPWFLFYQTTPMPIPIADSNETIWVNITVCMDEWPLVHARGIYFFVVITGLLYALPLLCISFFYAAIAYRVWRRYDGITCHNDQRHKTTKGVTFTKSSSKCKISKSHVSISSTQKGTVSPNSVDKPSTNMSVIGGMDREKTLRLVKMLVTVVSVFALSWLPLYLLFNLLFLIPDSGVFWSHEFEEVLFHYLIPFSQLLGASNTCVNPWIYFFYSKHYRKSFIEILSCRIFRHQLSTEQQPGFRKSRAYLTCEASRSVENNQSIVALNHQSERFAPSTVSPTHEPTYISSL